MKEYRIPEHLVYEINNALNDSRNFSLANRLCVVINEQIDAEQTGLAKQIAETEVAGSQWRDH